MTTRSPRTSLLLLLAVVLPSLATLRAQSTPATRQAVTPGPIAISGIYPHLAVFSDGGTVQDAECGIGGVVPWAGKLWLITYPPHRRLGSADKLYAIDDQLRVDVRPESVGGTHADRFIHRESRQLIIGPYFIDADGRVRVLDQRAQGMPARITAVARHLTDPANKVYMVDMEGPIWEVDVHTLAARRLFVKPVPGWHGKGGYTGQGRLIVTNNGASRTPDLDGLTWEAPESTWSRGPEEAGVLAEFDGKDWTIISRRPHTEVTGPGGLTGEPAPGAPVWSTGWDKRSVLLQVRSPGLVGTGAWTTYRLPKGSYTYDPAHGWFTEWPRIREIGDGPLLLNMHGTFFDFPATFAPGRAAGVRPLSTHLHYTTDFTAWNGRVVLAGDDTSIMQNPLAGRPQSNLRFVTRPQLAADFGPRSGWGGVWVNDDVRAGQASDPFLIAGYAARDLHLAHDADAEVAFTLEIDARGDGQWQAWKTISVGARGYRSVLLPSDVAAEWLRLKADRDCRATAYLHLSTPRPAGAAGMFVSLAPAPSPASSTTPASTSTGAAPAAIGGLLRPSAFSRDLQFLAHPLDANGRPGPGAEVYYEVNERLQFTRVQSPEKVAALKHLVEPIADYTADAASLIVIDTDKRRWRLPKASASERVDEADAGERRARTRGLREVVSERYLADFGGTFYEIPRLGTSVAPDYRRLKPIATHHARITDFCSWRGLLVLAGTRLDARPDGHFFRADESGAGLWFGAVDDLYALGAPAGEGGPWKDTSVNAGEPSDPYVMTNFGRKSVALSHHAAEPVRVAVEVDFLADGSWHTYDIIDVPPAQTIVHRFPDGFSAHWVRVTANRATRATAWFTYTP